MPDLLTTEQLAELKAAIKEGVGWLVSDQDPEAVLSHRGMYRKDRIGPLALNLCPDGARGWPVFIFDIENTFTEELVQQIRETVEEVVQVAEDWNGVPYFTYSISIKALLGDGIKQALRNYHDAGISIFDDSWWKEHAIRTTKPKGWQ